jgi:hypothetical protein
MKTLDVMPGGPRGQWVEVYYKSVHLHHVCYLQPKGPSQWWLPRSFIIYDFHVPMFPLRHFTMRYLREWVKGIVCEQVNDHCLFG